MLLLSGETLRKILFRSKIGLDILFFRVKFHFSVEIANIVSVGYIPVVNITKLWNRLHRTTYVLTVRDTRENYNM